MRADLLLTSCWRDLPWLRYNLEFLVKNWQNADSQIVVRLNEDCRPIIEGWAENPRITYHYGEPWPDTYAYQMWIKMHSDDYTDADLIVLIDSDVMLLQKAGIDDLMIDGKPVIYFLEWDEAEPVAQQKWRPSTSKAMGMDLDRDYMVTTPFTFWRNTFALTRDHMAKTAGRPFDELAYSTTPYDYRSFLSHPIIYSEHEALSLYASKYQAHLYEIQHRPHRNWPFQLFWSHGFTSGTAVKLQEMLDT